MRRVTRWSAVLVCLLAVAGAWAQEAAPAPVGAASAPADPAAILKAIPADASAFVAVPSLKELDAHVAGVAQQLQLQGLIPSPLELFKSNVGVAEGLDENGGMAFVVLNLSQVKTADELAQHLAFLVPAAKPDDMIKSLGGEKQGEVFNVTVMGQKSVAAPVKGFVVVSEKPETLKAMLDPKGGIIKTMSPEQVKAFARSDLLAWANPSTISKELRSQVADQIKAAMPGAAMGAAATQPAMDNTQWQETLDQLEEASLGLSLDQAKGLIVSVYTVPKSGTAWAKSRVGMKGAATLLGGLPNEPTILTIGMMGAAGDPAKAQQLRDGLDQMFKLLGTAGVEVPAERADALKQPLVKLLTDVEQLGVSLAGLPVEGGEGRIGLTLVARVKDSAEWKGLARKFFEQVKQFAMDIAKQKGRPEDRIQAVGNAVTWKENAEQVEGVQVDHFVVDVEKLVPPDQAEQAKQGIEQAKTILGKEGVLVRVAAVGKDRVLVTFGGGAPRFATAMAAARKDAPMVAENAALKKVADRLPAGARTAEGYISLDNLLNLVSSAMAQMGQQMPIPLTLNNAAPIAFASIKGEGAAQNVVVVVPMELISAVKEMVGPMLMMMSPGGMPEPGGEPKPAPSGELQ